MHLFIPVFISTCIYFNIYLIFDLFIPVFIYFRIYSFITVFIHTFIYAFSCIFILMPCSFGVFEKRFKIGICKALTFCT